MSPRAYALLIDMGGILAGLLVMLPVLLFMVTGWVVRRDKLISYMEVDALQVYYDQFPWTSSQQADLKKRFEEQFHYLYGRRHFIVPVALLFVVTTGILWAVVRTVQSLNAVSPYPLALKPVALSALLGGMLWVISDELDRIRKRDLAPMDVCGWVFRLLVAIPFGFAFAAIMKDDVGIPLAFLLGAFPTRSLFTMARRIGVQKLGLGDQQSDSSLELEKLQSIGRANAERFQDEGIDAISTLAWVDPIDLTIRTNFDFNYVLDCMSQALLWVYFEDKTRLLFPLSLRGAQEARGLVESLNGVTFPLDATQQLNADQKKAVATLQEASKVLGISDAACSTALVQVADDPYTVFIENVWR